MARSSIPKTAPVLLALVVLGAAPPWASAELTDCLAPGVDDRCEAWVTSFADPGADTHVVNGITLRPQADIVYLFGYSSHASTGPDFTTAAVSTGSGEVLWRARYQGPTQPTQFPSDHANAAVVSSDGGALFVAGWQDLYAVPGAEPQTFKPYADMGIVAYDAVTGAELWSGSFGKPLADDRAWDVALDPEGDRVYVTGWSSGEGTGFDYVTAAFDAGSGDRLWAARYDGPFATDVESTGAPDDRPFKVRVSPDGERVFVTGWSRGPAGDYDIATVAYDSGIHDSEGARHGGEVLWVTRYDGGVRGLDGVHGMEVSPDGTLVYLAGTTSALPAGDSCDDCDFLVVALDATTGGEEWTRRYQGPRGNDRALYLAVAPAGDRLYVTGSSAGAQGDWATIAYDAGTGNEVWSSAARYTSPTPDNEDNVRGIAVSPDGSSVFVTGYSANPVFNGPPKTFLHADAVTVAYRASDGGQAWIARHNSSVAGLDTYAEDLSFLPSTIAVAPDGARAFVGRTFASGVVDNYQYNFGLVAYDT